MAYGVIMCCHLHMPLYILGTFTEYPYCNKQAPGAQMCSRGLCLERFNYYL